MNNLNNTDYPPPNPETRRSHRRQTWLQILLPMIAGALIIILLAVLAATASTGQVSRFSNISLTFLVLPTAATGLIFLTLFGAVIYGLTRLIGVLPHWAARAQHFIKNVTRTIKEMSDKAAQPVVTADSVWAGAKVFFNRQPPRPPAS